MNLVSVVIDRNFNQKNDQCRHSDRGYIMERLNSHRDHLAMMRFTLPGAVTYRHFYLHDDVGEWLLAKGVRSHQCSLDWKGGPRPVERLAALKGEWLLGVPESIALLFKLTWGGQ